MKLLLDVNISPVWRDYLRAAGHHAVHWTAIGDARALDTEIARYAGEQGFVIVTRDLDFGALLAASRLNRPSVVLLRGPHQFPVEAGQRVLNVLRETESDLGAGAFVTVDVNKTRVHILPIRPV